MSDPAARGGYHRRLANPARERAQVERDLPHGADVVRPAEDGGGVG